MFAVQQRALAFSMRSLSTSSKFAIAGRISNTAQEDLDKWKTLGSSGRPVAPHLSVYKWSIPMTMSAVYRISAFGLMGMIFAFPAAYVTMGVDASYITSASQSIRNGSPIMLAVWLGIKSSFVAPFVYHCVNGCRHLGWDHFAYGIRHLKDVYTSGNIVMAVTAILTAVIVLYSSN